MATIRCATCPRYCKGGHVQCKHCRPRRTAVRQRFRDRDMTAEQIDAIIARELARMRSQRSL